MNAPTVCGLTVKDVAKHVAYWQRRLKLEHWSLKVEIVGPRELPDEAAQNEFNPHRRTATIRVASDAEGVQDLHDSIIHELLHLHLFFVRGDLENELLEQAFHCICPMIAEMHVKKLEDLGDAVRDFAAGL
jgi:dsRNA-specific ribonuclease